MGLGFTRQADITENMIRAEHGVSMRAYYDKPDPE